jgi:hypothetical protein
LYNNNVAAKLEHAQFLGMIISILFGRTSPKEATKWS